MASPTKNTLTYTTFTPSSAQDLQYGLKWGGAVGTGITITYSFPNKGTWAANYGTNALKEHKSMQGLTSQEIASVKAALAAWAGTGNVSFKLVSDTASTVGEIRFGVTNNMPLTAQARAYYPFWDPSAGDVWFNNALWNTDDGGTPKGSYDFWTILHEVGHALGLKHPFDRNGANKATSILNDPYDNFFYTVMSYTASNNFSADKDNYASFYPTTPMYYDLLAIQHLYGKKAVNSTSTVYTFNDGSTYFQCINDSGGVDTIVYNGVDNAVINLNQKTFSQVSEPISFTSGTSRATVSIGPGVVIERATGGSGHDTLTGNAAANLLSGRAGDDTLRGNSGNDILNGGFGSDTYNGGAGSDTFMFTGAIEFETLLDYVVSLDVIKLDNAIFTALGAPRTLPSVWFRKGAAALDGNDFIIYDPTTGNLIYDTNGSDIGQDVVFAVMPTNLAMTNAEFVII